MMDPDLQVAATKLTTTGVVMGTPLYMAPEQAMGADIDHLADIYACGVIMYELLAGVPPFDGATYAVLVAKLLTTEPPLLTTHRPGLSAKLVSAVHRALEKDPQKRFASADAFAAALPQATSASALELASTQASGARAVVPRPAGKARRWPILAASLAMLAGIATATAIIMAQNKHPEPAATATEPAKAAEPAKAPEPTKAPEPARAPEPTKVEDVAPAPVPSKTGWLEVSSKPSGAEIVVDGKSIGSAPTGIALLPGPHKVHAELLGFTADDTEEQIDLGSKTSLTVAMAPVAATPTKARPGIKTPPPKGPKSTSTSTTKVLTQAEIDALMKRALPSEDPAKVPPPPPPIKRTDPPKTPPTGPDTTPKPNPY